MKAQNNHTQRYSATTRTLRHAIVGMLVCGTFFAGTFLMKPAAAFALQTSPTSLSFTGIQGSTNPSAQSVTISKHGDREKSWTARSSADWLMVSPSSGSISTEKDQLTVGVNLSNVVAGTYTGAITITTVGTQGHTRNTTLSVSLNVQSATTTSGFTLSPSSLTFSATVGSPDKSGSITVTNTGTASVTATWSEGLTWLTTVQPAATQTMNAGQSTTFTTTASFAGLSAGTYSGAATISSGGITKSIPVTLTVTPATSATGFTVSPASMNYTGTVGGPNVVAGLAIANSGTAAMTVTWSDNIGWLVATSGDSVAVASGGTASITHTASPAGLAAGKYSGTATVSGGGVTKQIPVTLTLTSSSSTTPTTISLGPANLAFSGTVGAANPAAQNFTVTKAGSGAITWTASDNAAWLTLSPSTGTGTAAATASVNLSGLAAGTYNATINVASTGTSNTPQSIPVSLTVLTSTAGSATLTWAANTESDLAGYKIYTGTQSGIYGPPLSVGKVTSYQLMALAKGTTYFITITAYDSAGNESLHAAEVSKSVF